ncbi:hypothetical protein [Barrientosiimonas endolithica]|uniref:RecG wedge domain-containing protein n=1 Tax=Barrientosiimonas endolithica TaxID=1535208 RepID=A0ABN6YT86_9MICO|nr:hypothetical protein [Barrientosiimonas endolithica]BDZ58703.1 hypothetical protein GCM10025872_23600 [Barrientosiimonas endolithica]
MADPITRETRLSKVVGAPAKKLATERDIVTVGDLLDFHPRRYIDVETSGRITDFALDDHVAIVATVVSGTTSRNRASRGSRFEATLVDAEDNEFNLVFFRPYGHEQALQPGRRVLARGKLGSSGGARSWPTRPTPCSTPMPRAVTSTSTPVAWCRSTRPPRASPTWASPRRSSWCSSSSRSAPTPCPTTCASGAG